jgi:Tfp pilus assembly protein PilE
MTLIEVIIAVAVFAIASLILINAFIISAKLDNQSAALSTQGSNVNESIDKRNFASTTTKPDFLLPLGPTAMPIEVRYLTSEDTDTDRTRIDYVTPSPIPSAGP